jgi:hypothetical protein
MNAAQNDSDNAFPESCFGAMKAELELVEYAGGPGAGRERTGHVRYYNESRRHSSLGTSPQPGSIVTGPSRNQRMDCPHKLKQLRLSVQTSGWHRHFCLCRPLGGTDISVCAEFSTDC